MHKKICTDLPHMNFFHGSTAQHFPQIYTSARNDRTDFPPKDLPHIFCINKSCLNFNKIVLIETIGKKIFNKCDKKIQKCAEYHCAEDSVRKIRAVILCGRFCAINSLKNCAVHSFLLSKIAYITDFCRILYFCKSSTKFMLTLKQTNFFINRFFIFVLFVILSFIFDQIL
jgi:hypothetical protein